MKKTILALAALVTGVSAYAQKPADLAVTLDVAYVSNYVFRGALRAEDSIQPSIEASYKDIYAGVWLSDEMNSSSSNETDFYAGYNLAINETFSADFGVTRYTYESASGLDSTEVYGGLKANVLLSPSVYYYYDFDRDVSSYIASIGHSLPIAKLGLSVDLSATFGYIQIPGDNQDYSYWGVGAAVPYKLSDAAKLTAGVNYTHADSANLPAAARSTSRDQDEVAFSVGLSVGF